jgi:hypothetical protein
LTNRPKSDLREEAIDIRRERVLELTTKGYNQRQIASMIQVSKTTIVYDQLYLKTKAKDNMKKYVDDTLPAEYEKCLNGISLVLREAWNIYQNEESRGTHRIQALYLAKECYGIKIDLLTNTEIVNDASRWILEKKKELLLSEQGQLILQQPPQEQEQEQKEEQEPETFNKTF